MFDHPLKVTLQKRMSIILAGSVIPAALRMWSKLILAFEKAGVIISSMSAVFCLLPDARIENCYRDFCGNLIVWSIFLINR